MKVKYLTSLLITLTLFTSCEKWLDVNSELDIYEETLFEEAEGYYAALNGLYIAMGGQNLYGKELTFGAVEAWGGSYILDKENHQSWDEIANFKYENTAAQGVASGIWLDAFNVIAEANNLLQNLNKDTETRFPEGDLTKNMILGEAYAIRAMMHFELVRVFAQAPVSDGGGVTAYVPYVTVFPSKINTPLPTKEVLQNIIADLEKAKDLVAPMDTLEGNKGYISFQYNNVSTRLPLNDGYVTSVKDEFFQYRALRFNYWAMLQLLSRVCLYAGEKDKAYTYASAVVNMVESKKFYSFTYPSAIACPVFVYSAEPRLHKEMLLGLYRTDYPDWTDLYFGMRGPQINVAGIRDIFAGNLSDVRYTGGFYADYLMKYYWNVTEDMGGNVRLMNATKNFIPVLRFPECYYIAAESVFEKNPGRAIEIFNLMADARSNSSLKLSEGISADNFREAIVREYRREFIGEGYLVYVYKRLNLPLRIEEGVTVEHHGKLVMPVPNNESAIQ